MVDYLNLQQKGGHQMGKYKIKVKVEIVETDDLEVGSLTKGKDGSFEININEVDAISIDKCERALLRANYPAIREAISSHLSEVSKKKSLRSGRRKS